MFDGPPDRPPGPPVGRKLRLPTVPPATKPLDASSEFSGTLKLQKNLHVDGAVEGEIDCAATVTIGSSGRVTASVCAESVVIDGEIHGDIEARSEITLSKTARVYGDIMTEGIVIERGAKVEGRITIGPVKSAKREPASDLTREVQREPLPGTSGG
jgi:cytoskeletal protein CcmA (bactofilin family)